LGILRAEIDGGGVDDAGVHRGAAQADDDQSQQREKVCFQGQRHQNHACADGEDAGTDHGSAAKAVSHESVEDPTKGDAKVVKGGKPGGSLIVDTPVTGHIAAGPKARGGFQCAVAEKGEENIDCAGKPDGLRNRKYLWGGFRVIIIDLGAIFPYRQRQKKCCGQDDLQERDAAVAHFPTPILGQAETHDIGADGNAYAPKGVEPAHVPGGVVQSHIVIQRRIHSAGAEAVGNRPQAEHPEVGRQRKAQQRCGGKTDADGSDQAGAQPPDDPVGK